MLRRLNAVMECDKLVKDDKPEFVEEMNMKKFRTVACVIIMSISAITGFFIGAFLNEAMGGAILFSMIAGIACIVYNIENREE